MKITTAQLREIVREEIKRMKREGYEHITKNDGYTKDQTEPSEYTDDGADIYAAEKGEIKESKRLTLKSITEDEKWIQKAVDPSKKGQLHKDLGVPQDQTIPQSKLKAVAEKGGKVGQRARFALNVRGLK